MSKRKNGEIYVDNGVVWKSPIVTEREGGTSISVGFPVCTPSDLVNANDLAQIIQNGDGFSELQTSHDALIAENMALRAAANNVLGYLVNGQTVPLDAAAQLEAAVNLEGWTVAHDTARAALADTTGGGE